MKLNIKHISKRAIIIIALSVFAYFASSVASTASAASKSNRISCKLSLTKKAKSTKKKTKKSSESEDSSNSRDNELNPSFLEGAEYISKSDSRTSDSSVNWSSGSSESGLNVYGDRSTDYSNGPDYVPSSGF